MSAGNLHVETRDRDIIVTLPGTNFMVTYFKPVGTSHLIARPNWTNDPDASIELGEFLEQALTAANTKARKLGWIVLGKRWYQSKDGDAINTNTKLTLLVFIVFFLALALAALWMI